MIVFDGYITGNAERFFNRKSKKSGLIILAISMLLIFPVFIIIGVNSQNDVFLKISIYGIFVFTILGFWPKSKKHRKAFTPKKIFIEEDCITCVADKYTETKFVEDAKKVFDYGEFYYLTFPMGNISEKFVCQKSLLSKGSLEEFESLFVEKIERVGNTEDGSLSSDES